MSPSTPEEIVRRATVAFNAGQPDEAQKLCEKGLEQKPGDPMLGHLLAAVLFSKGEVAAARAPIEASLAKRPDNAAALLLAARIARAASDFDAALNIWIARSRCRRSARCLSKRRGRWTRQAWRRRRARPGARF